MYRSALQKFSRRTFGTTRSALDVARLTLVGRVGGTIEPLQSKSGNTYVKYALAVRTGKDQTSWFNVTAFDPRAIEFMQQYVEKGSLVYVEADASITKYEVDGLNRTSLNLVQQSISPLTWPKRAEGEAAEPEPEA